MKRAARIALWAFGALLWLTMGFFMLAAEFGRWAAQGTEPIDWLAAIGLGLLIGGLAGAGV